MLYKKHFNNIASILNDIPNTDDKEIAFNKKEVECMQDCKEIIAKNLADYFEILNPKFDRNKFLTKSGVRI